MDEMRQKLIEEMGIAGLSQEQQDDLIDKMTEVMLKKIYLETMDRLDDKAKGEFDQLLESNPAPEAVEAFVKERITDYDEMVGKIVRELVAELKKIE